MPLARENVRIGVLHISDPFAEGSGYAYAHQMGIEEMKRSLGIEDNQILYITNVDYAGGAESAMRQLIAQGANIIIATSWGYMETCEKLAVEYPSVVFAHASGYRYNDTNFTNYFGRVYQARYLSGIIAGAKTQTNRIGYVAAWGTGNSEVSGGINAFALGVEKVNPQARVYVRVTNSWFDPMGETAAARVLIAAGCDIIAQHVNTASPQIETERAGLWGIGFNTDMSIDAPGAVLTSVLWQWGAYYTFLVQSVIDGTFTTTPYFGSLTDGIVDLSPLSGIIFWDPETIRMLDEERQRIESGAFDVFEGVLETNDGRFVGREGERLPDREIQFGIDWHYRTVIEL
jgi:basic membrane protein A